MRVALRAFGGVSNAVFKLSSGYKGDFFNVNKSLKCTYAYWFVFFTIN